MSRYHDTQLNHRKACVSILNSLFSWMEISHWTQARYLDQRNEKLYASNHYQRLSGYNKAYVNGIENERFWGKYGFYNTKLEYCHGLTDGTIIGLSEGKELAKSDPNFYRNLTFNHDEELSGAYYKDKRIKF